MLQLSTVPAAVLLAAAFTQVGTAQQTPQPGHQHPEHQQPGHPGSGHPDAKADRNSMGSPRLSAQDHEFVTKAAAGGMMENEAGQLAMQKGNSQAVKDFGQRMVNDHSKANEKLKALAESKGISVPSTLDAEGRKKTSQLAAKSGDAFDKAYAGMMLKDHQKVIALFERQQSSGTDEDLKSFAAETLPTLRDHLKAAQDLPGNARGGSASSQ